jgi:hypothetical protein
MVEPIWRLVGPCAAILALQNHLDLKPIIYMSHSYFTMGATEKQRIDYIDLKTTRIGEDTLLEPLLVAPSPPSTSSPSSP